VFSAVLFDFFGTLTHAVRRGPVHATIAHRLGCDPAAFIAELDATFHARASGAYGGQSESLRRLAANLGADPRPHDVRIAATGRELAIQLETRLRAEAVPVLRALRARGLGTGLVSDCTHELPWFLPRLPVAPLLDACVYSVASGACKPEPDVVFDAERDWSGPQVTRLAEVLELVDAGRVTRLAGVPGAR
jgi:putative hydrolase of the HAD superfamily